MPNYPGFIQGGAGPAIAPAAAGSDGQRLLLTDVASQQTSWADDLTATRNTWAEAQISAVNAVAFATTIADDCDSGPLKQKTTLTGSITNFNLLNGDEGQERLWYFYQDGTGGHDVTFDASIVGTAPTIDPDPSALTVVHCELIEGGVWRFV